MGIDAVIFKDSEALDIGERFYGPGYERGNWPVIRDAILASGATHYGGDYQYVPVPVTPELIAALDEHWAKYSIKPYNENFDTPDTGQWPKEWTRDFTAPNISS